MTVSQDLIKSALPQITDKVLLAEISKQGVIETFEEGDLIIDQGVPIQYVPIVLEGTLRVVRQDEDGHELLLYYLSAGDSCASSLNCCMARKMSEIQAIAEEKVTILGIPPLSVDRWIGEYSEWKDMVVSTFQRRFNDLLHSLEMIAFNRLDERLEEYLRSRSEVLGTKVLKTSHQEIANHLNSSREVISRLLKQLEKLGRVKLARNIIELKL